MAKVYTAFCRANGCQFLREFKTKKEAEHAATSHSNMNRNEYNPHNVGINEEKK